MSFPLINLKKDDHDLIFKCILPRLSYKSLSRFKCVSKTWHKTISKDTKFARDQSIRVSPSSCGVVFSNCRKNKVELFETFGSPIGINPRHHLFTNPNVELIRVMASSCGLVRIQLEHKRNGNKAPSFYIGNLATKEVDDVVPADGLGGAVVGLAFDPSIEPNSYKLVNPIWIPGSPNGMFAYEFNIYSSGTHGWVRSSKSVCVGTSRCQHVKAVTLKNVVYWDCYNYAISFDPWKDIGGYIELPKHERESFNQELGTCNGRITWARMVDDNKYMQVYIYYEREERWESRYIVDLVMLIDANPDLLQESFGKRGLLYNAYPFPYDGGGRLFFRMYKGKTEVVFSYDVRSKKGEFHEFPVRRYNRRIFTYHNSMVKMPALQSK